MQIKGLGNSINKLHEQYKKHEKAKAEVGEKKVADKLEISEEAKLLQSQNISGKEAAQIRDKISSGFYNSEEVLNKVAEAILKELYQN